MGYTGRKILNLPCAEESSGQLKKCKHKRQSGKESIEKQSTASNDKRIEFVLLNKQGDTEGISQKN